MKLAILSDTHDQVWAVDWAARFLQQADVVLHCGDLCSPFMIPRLVLAANGKPVHIVWGNNDGDKRLIGVQAAKAGGVFLHGDFAAFEFDGVKVAMNHYPEIGRALASSGQYHLVCYGHDHTAHQEQIATCTLLNPGELMGLYGRRSFVLYETSDRSIDWVDVEM